MHDDRAESELRGDHNERSAEQIHIEFQQCKYGDSDGGGDNYREHIEAWQVERHDAGQLNGHGERIHGKQFGCDPAFSEYGRGLDRELKNRGEAQPDDCGRQLKRR